MQANKVLPQFLDLLDVENILVRADDHAVLLVHGLVHLGTYSVRQIRKNVIFAVGYS
jgi:hypothetical protein